MFVPEKIEAHLMSTQLMGLVHRLPSPRFTSRANLTHIVETTIRTAESLFTRAMAKQIGKRQTALTARVDMLSLCERTPALSKNCKRNGHKSRAEYTASFTGKHLANLAKV